MKRYRHISGFGTGIALWALFTSLLGTVSLAEGKHHARVRVIAEPWDGHSTIKILIRFQMDKGWHLYWQNPGDSGLPPAFDWLLPEGFSISEPEYPVPEKMQHDEEITFGYTREFFLTAEITPPAGYRADQRELKLTAQADWLVCRDRCVQEKVTVVCKVPAFSPQKHRSFERLWRKARAALPHDSDPAFFRIISAVQTQDGAGQRNTVALYLPGPFKPVDFYPHLVKDAVINLQSIQVKDGTVSFLLTPELVNTRIDSVSGILVVGRMAYRCTFRFS